nr:F0F1 ATP synthase subunit B [uncultured Sphingosinicella sp.]
MANQPTDPQSAEIERDLQEQSTKGEHGQMPETGGHAATTAADEGHGAPHAEPAIFGILDATVIVSLSMLVVIAIMLWKKVPAAIGRALDKKIAGIREQLDEAARLRAEAEALRSEYEAKTASAGAEAQAMLDRARHEADTIVQQAQVDAANLVERRTLMAESKIAAAERTAIAEVRARAVTAATAAAERLIIAEHDAKADRAMIDRTIAGLGRTH